MSQNKYEQLAQSLLELIGGKENITFISHCATRLRLNVKDRSRVDEANIKKLPGVLGCQFSSGQFQVIIGPDVNRVFEIIAPKVEGNDLERMPQEEQAKEKVTLKSIFNKSITSLSSCITPILPIIVCTGFIRMIALILGPNLLNLLPEDNGLNIILTLTGSAGFYFLPIFIGYTSAKHFKTDVLLGMLMGGVLLHPTLIEVLSEGSLDLLGLPVTPVSYAYSVLPIILSVWIMSYVRKAVDSIIPEVVKLILVNLITLLIMLPLMLVVFGPLGSILSEYITVLFLSIHKIFGPFGIGLIAALYLVLILTGMHHAVNLAAIVAFTSQGYDDVIFVGATAASIAVIGAILGFIIKAKKKENKSLGITALAMQALVGIVEPALFGIVLPHKKVLAAHSIGAFIGGTVLGLFQVKKYTISSANLMILLGFIGEQPSNFILGCIGSIIGALVAFTLVLVLGFDEGEENALDY